jgi:hypothetical protein
MVGVVAGVLGLAGFRFATVPPPAVTHHHANWALFVDGERVDLSDARYMEDVAACRADPASIGPRDRVHLHDGNADVVHVHHPAATWGHLMTNLGFHLGPDFVVTADGERHFAEGERTLKFFRNGIQLPELHNEAIRSEDRVLITFGAESAAEALVTQFPRVADDAAEHNEKADPGACMGGHEPESFRSRLERAFVG